MSDLVTSNGLDFSQFDISYIEKNLVAEDGELNQQMKARRDIYTSALQ